MQIKEFFYDFHGFNTHIFEHLNDFLGSGYYMRLFVRALSNLGNIKFMPITMSIIFVLLLSWSYLKHRSIVYMPESHKSWLKSLLVAIFSCFISALIIFPMKKYFLFPRPLCILDNINIIWEFTHHSAEALIAHRCNGDGSFPSMHSVTATVLAASFWPKFNRTGKILAVLYCLSIGLTRIAIGVHFPADILWAYLIGFVIAKSSQIMFEKLADFGLKFVTPCTRSN